MSTATQDVEDRAESEVESLRTRVSALEDEIERLEARDEELKAEAARQKADTDEVDDDLRAELAEVRSDREIAGTALEVKRRQLRQAEDVALREEARDRLRTIVKRVGGMAGEQPRRVERAVEALERAEEQLEKAAEARALAAALESEAAVLCRVFDLDEPDLRDVPSLKTYKALAGGGAAQGWLGWTPSRVLGSYDRMTSGARRVRDEEPVAAIRRLEGINVPLDSPTAELLEKLEELEAADGEEG